MEPGRRLGAAHVVPGTDAVLLSWNLHGRETEAERGQPEPWRAEERCVWDLRRFCFPATWRPFHPPKIDRSWVFLPTLTSVSGISGARSAAKTKIRGMGILKKCSLQSLKEGPWGRPGRGALGWWEWSLCRFHTLSTLSACLTDLLSHCLP